MPTSSAVPRRMTKSKATRVIVGIDFGTTYSGIAWSTSNNVERINVLTDWRAVDYSNNDKQKVPTALHYGSLGTEPEWGYQIQPEEPSMKWFKILLLDDKDIPAYLRNSAKLSRTRELLEQVDKTPIEAVADYLRALWKHASERFERALGKTMLNGCSFQFVVTLPAIWPHYAQVRMREALQMSGVLSTKSEMKPTLSFVSEPEAAALATIEDLIDRAEVEAGDHFVVCDAGGGTVDLITYEITTTNPMTVRESVKGDGDLCGAILLDESFSCTARALLPKSIWEDMGQRAIRRMTYDHWENGIKGAFTGSSDVTWNIPLPYGGTVRDRYQSPDLTIKGTHVLAIFRPVVARIEALVAKQIEEVKKQYGKIPKYVVVVGGFGKSCYLHDRLEATVARDDIEVLYGFGERPWTAVCRGAVIKGLTDNRLMKSMAVVDSRIARASYGTLFNVLPFEAEEHHPADRVYCEVHQAFLAVEQTAWFLQIGEKLDSGEYIRSEFWQDMEKPDDEIDIELVVSDAETPPTRKDATVRSLCNIRLSKVPGFKNLPSWINTEGRTFRRFQYELRIICTGASLDVGVYHKNRRLQSRNVSVEFNNSTI